MRVVFAFTAMIFLSLAENANATTLFCAATNMYIKKDGNSVELAFSDQLGQKTTASRVRLLSSIPEWQFTALIEKINEPIGFCRCKKKYKIQKSISLLKNGYGYFEAKYETRDRVSKFVSIDVQDWKDFSSVECRMATLNFRNQDFDSAFDWNYYPEIAKKTKKIMSSFEPRFNCDETPIQHVDELIKHLGNLYDEHHYKSLRSLISMKEAEDSCEVRCDTFLPNQTVYCEKTDLQ